MAIRSFRHRIFLAILLVGLAPATVAVIAGTLTLREIGTTVGTLGPWDAVAESGRTLMEAADSAAPEDPAVQAAVEDHRRALGESVRWSRLWSFLTGRVVSVLPLLALVTAAGIGLLAFLVARWLSRGFGEPIQELVGWTRRIARGDPLPPRQKGTGRRGIQEFESLRDSLRAMAEELEVARLREVETVRLKAWTEMARRVAHELKNPLTPMRMAAATLARTDEPAEAEAAEVLLEEIGRLDDMARTFSQFGRMPEGPRSEIDLSELCREVARRQELPEVPVIVEADADTPLVRGHYELLARAVRNLVVNAVEAVQVAHPAATGRDGDTPPTDSSETAVRIRIERTDDAVRVRIRDSGPGLDEDLLDTIWLPDVTTKSGGTGLGLAMVRQAAETHGGVARARNRTDGSRGAEFELVLPLEASPEDGSGPGDDRGTDRDPAPRDRSAGGNAG